MAMVPRLFDARRARAGKPELFACVLALTTFPAAGQILMPGSSPGGVVRLFNSDAAILEAGETRKDIPCTVTPAKPMLGFDLKFHGGYEVAVPLKELAGSENMLTIVFRMAPDNHKDNPIYFGQRVRVPSIDDEAKGDAYF